MISPHLAPLLKPGVTYDDATALHLAEFAQAVYSHGDDFFEHALNAGYDRPVLVEQGAAQVGCAVGRYGLMVACRGSSERLDWRANAQAWRVGWKDMLPGEAGVHRGFLRQVKRIRKRLTAKVRVALGGRTASVPMYVCGHSLGGAIAPLVALCLGADLGLRLEALYTYESPRPGNEEFSRWWGKVAGSLTHRVVVVHQGEADVVTRLPPSACGWWHVGRPQIIRDGVRYEDAAEWERVRGDHPVRPLPQWRVVSRLIASIRAHDMGDLVETLRGMHARRMESKAAVIAPLEVNS